MTTRSKLGGVYPTSTIQAMDKEAHQTLKQLRSLPGNKECAECKTSPSTWASVTLGVFVCMDCAQVHRNLGAHISKVKSCMGTYLWCPDELERMKEIGNSRAWALFTGGAPPGTAIDKPASGAAFEVRDRFARDKYEAQKWMHPGGMAAVLAEERIRSASAPAPAPRVLKKSGDARRLNAKARRDARSKVQAMRCRGRQDAAWPQGGSTGADTTTLLPAASQADDDWASAEWDSWSPQPRPSAGRTRAASAASVPAPAPALAEAPTVEPTDAFDAFFQECVGSPPQQQSTGGASGSSTDLIDLFAPAPAVTTGLLSRQVSAH